MIKFIQKQLNKLWLGRRRKQCADNDHAKGNWVMAYGKDRFLCDNCFVQKEGSEFPVEKGYEDIYNSRPYLKSEVGTEGEVAYIDILYVPPHLRKQGYGTQLMWRFLWNLPPNIKRVRVNAVALGSGSTKAFYRKFGFTPAYQGFITHECRDVMVVGVNGHPTPPPEHLRKGQAEEEFRDLYEDENTKQFLTFWEKQRE